MANINWGNLLFGFSGRINRAKWWLSILVYIIVGVVAAIIAAVVGETAWQPCIARRRHSADLDRLGRRRQTVA